MSVLVSFSSLCVSSELQGHKYANQVLTVLLNTGLKEKFRLFLCYSLNIDVVISALY